MFVNVEDPQTVRSFKMLPEDCGTLHFEGNERAIRLEGYRYTHSVNGIDVVEAYLIKSFFCVYTVLAYRVKSSNVVLELAISNSTFIRTLMWQVGYRVHPPIVRRLEKTLQIQIAEKKLIEV